MENNILVNFLKEHFNDTVSMVEKIIEICPDELWNSKKSGFVVWQQLMHTLAPIYGWLREELGYKAFNEIKGGKIYLFPEKDPEIILSKEDVKKRCSETKETVEKWFSGKDDEWLKSPYKIYNEWTNLYAAIGQIERMMYHIGYCDAIALDKLRLMLKRFEGFTRYDFFPVQSDNYFKSYIINKDIIKQISNKKHFKIKVSDEDAFYLSVGDNIKLSNCLSLIYEYINWLLGDFRIKLINFYNKKRNGMIVDTIWYESITLNNLAIEIQNNYIISAEITYDEGAYDIDSQDEGLLNVKLNGRKIHSMYYDFE